MSCPTCEEPLTEEFQVPDITKFSTTNMFTVYAMEGCDHCEKVKELLHLTGQQFVVYTLGQHFTIEQFQDEFNGKQFPQVVVDLVGVDERKMIGGAAEVAQYFRENNLA
tara:strand:- start:375 stop:701 length:327 start_codon:yes stop_codon:yes gene_type:complete